jgi:formamidopyrimidine-DNA glycosylase
VPSLRIRANGVPFSGRARVLTRITAAQVERLHAGIQRALRESVAAARSELAWRYENKKAPSPFRVYDRSGEPCVVCSTTLSSTTVGGRTTVWCTHCQPSA